MTVLLARRVWEMMGGGVVGFFDWSLQLDVRNSKNWRVLAFFFFNLRVFINWVSFDFNVSYSSC